MQREELSLSKSLTKPSREPVWILIVLQPRLIEEEARRAIPHIDGNKVPFFNTKSAPTLLPPRHAKAAEKLTGIIIVQNHIQAPRESSAEVELLVRTIQVADGGVLDGLEGDVA